jgi:flagellar protein FlgJ
MTAPSDSVSPKSYLDFSGLGELRGQARKSQDKAIQQSAQQFEGLFIQMMMKSMRDATPKDEENQSSALDTFQGMFDQEVSVQMAKRNAIGVADFMVKAVQQQGHPVTSSDFLRARQHESKGMPLNTPATPMSLNSSSNPMPLTKPVIKSLTEIKNKGAL